MAMELKLDVTGNWTRASCGLCRALFWLRFGGFRFCPVGTKQVGVAGEVVGPVPGDTAAAFGTERAAQTGDERALVIGRNDGDLVRPERQEPGQVLGTVVRRAAAGGCELRQGRGDDGWVRLHGTSLV